jgi:hypothetical protein
MIKFASVLATMVVTTSAYAATCACVGTGNMSVQTTSGPAMCSVTQSQNSCNTQQLGTSGTLFGSYQAINDKLDGVAQLDAARWLRFIATERPEDYRQENFVDALTVLFALSQNKETLKATRRYLDNNWHTLLPIFGDPAFQNQFQTYQFDRFDAVVSYGCLEITKGTFRTMARVPFSFTQGRCDRF